MITNTKVSELSPEDRALVERARELQKRAYAPVSKFTVGVALIGEDGKIYDGCNVEAATLTDTTHAERLAICKMVSEGTRKFTKLAVVTPWEKPLFPCGTCRQLMSEFGSEATVYGVGGDDVVITNMKDLLPAQFQMEHIQ